jgi:hypothetical protein
LVLKNRASRSGTEKEVTMLKKMLVLAMLIPAVGGCVLREESGSSNGHHSYRQTTVRPAHVHRDGCGHVYRGGIWIVVR